MADGKKIKFTGYVTSIANDVFEGRFSEHLENGMQGEEYMAEFNKASLNQEDRQHLQNGIPFEILIDEEADDIKINLIVRYWTQEEIDAVNKSAAELSDILKPYNPTL